MDVNLVPPEMIVPKLRRMLFIGIGLAVVLGLFFGLIAPGYVAVIVALVIGGPIVVAAAAGMRRNQSIDGTVITSRSGTTRVVDLATADSVTVAVHQGRVDQALLRADGISVTLAVYSGEKGRELPIDAMAALAEGLRSADARANHEVIMQPESDADTVAERDDDAHDNDAQDNDEPATRTELADLLKAQLRAEAVGAGVSDRPLYQAARFAEPGARGGTALTGAQAREVAE
ncbi:MAG: hypothetical protein L0H59_12310 [Tomitella sp.]|nr:hypothetical protein [Tomitella sp.]